MVIVAAGVGIVIGWLVSWLSDYLPRFSTGDDRPTGSAGLLPPAVVQLLTTTPRHWRAVFARQRWFWLHLTAEVSCAVGLAALIMGLGLTWQAAGTAAGLTYFLLIAILDIKYRLVLNIMTYPAIALVLALHLIVTGQDPLHVLMGGVFAFMIFFLTAWLKPGDIGGGDIKLAVLLGLMFGFPGVLWALIVGVGLGGLVAAALLLLTRRAGAKLYIPYAPFLCLGGAVALLYNPIWMM